MVPSRYVEIFLSFFLLSVFSVYVDLIDIDMFEKKLFVMLFLFLFFFLFFFFFFSRLNK